MSIWNELNENVRQSSRQWLDWAKQHAQDLGDAGMRHIERQDLLSERKQLLQRLGEATADRFLVEDKKTVRHDTPGVKEILERISAIDERLTVLSVADDENEEDRPQPEENPDQ
ncbi:MAG: hypothetical protein WD492_17995 [Alkalispirochaeta sp.]